MIVDESEAAVTVGLQLLAGPTDREVACPMDSRIAAKQIRLAAPLGSRTLKARVDGGVRVVPIAQ